MTQNVLGHWTATNFLPAKAYHSTPMISWIEIKVSSHNPELSGGVKWLGDLRKTFLFYFVWSSHVWCVRLFCQSGSDSAKFPWLPENRGSSLCNASYSTLKYGSGTDLKSTAQEFKFHSWLSCLPDLNPVYIISLCVFVYMHTVKSEMYENG